MNSRGARAVARVAGGAWLTGFALFVVSSAPLVLAGQLAGPLIGLVMYGVWALLLGVLLLRQPTRGRLLVSLVFAALLVALYAPLLLDPARLVALLPDGMAAACSLVALLLDQVPANPSRRPGARRHDDVP